jgi:hypothetical protein
MSTTPAVGGQVMATKVTALQPRERERREPDRAPTDVRPDPIPIELIAQRAYELFVERGGAHGHDVEDWLTAESELLRKRATQN